MALAQQIEASINIAITQKGHAFIAFSGGSTPILLFQTLATRSIAWENVTITLVDERWVPNSSEQSNEKLIATHLLNHINGAQFIALKRQGSSREEAIAQISQELDPLGSLDVAILGMGNDAHTASFFPHAPELESAFNLQTPLIASSATVEPFKRITFTRHFLLQSAALILHIEGSKKRETFLDALTSSNDPTLQMYEKPIISMMQAHNSTLKVYYAP